jgi:hypothetical protein
VTPVGEGRPEGPRRNEWVWSDDAGCFTQGDWHQPPRAYCLGDRYIHADYGLDSYGILWRGSTADHWHGWAFGFDLGRAIRWVRRAKHDMAGYGLWALGSAPGQPQDRERIP